ncbi:MAG: membrane-bound PQQ-dependent dehydrogenase, glucose/quinate/shikimate family, partial [Sphingopyxis sp.]
MNRLRRTFPAPLFALTAGAIVALIALVLLVGGIWLAVLGGSAYYAITGIAMLASGLLLMRGRLLGGWIYVAVVFFTLIWAFWEVGGNGWALVPRVVAPAVLLVLVLFAMASLSVRPRRWRLALASSAAVVALFVAGGTMLGWLNKAGPERALPGQRWAMADPALMQAGADWPAYGGSYSARRYSPLAQITPANVGKLKRAWMIHTGDLPSSAKVRGTYGAENTPLKVGDSLYVCTPKNMILALDPATGKQRWRFDPRVPDDAIPYTAACRGVSYYAVPDARAGQACARRIIFGTLDARLFALDAETGRPCQDFGSNGQVDTKIGMGNTPPGYVSINSPPTIVRGIVVTGHQVLDGQDRWAPSGVIRGF